MTIDDQISAARERVARLQSELADIVRDYARRGACAVIVQGCAYRIVGDVLVEVQRRRYRRA